MNIQAQRYKLSLNVNTNLHYFRKNSKNFQIVHAVASLGSPKRTPMNLKKPQQPLKKTPKQLNNINEKI